MSGKGKVLVDGDIVAYRAAFATQDYSKERYTKTEHIKPAINGIFGAIFQIE